MSTGLSILSEQVVKKRKQKLSYEDLWPEYYMNRETQKVYQPHNEDEEFFVYSNTPTRMLLRGGEGGGKTVAGTIKTLNRLKGGMSGIMGSPDMPHFRRSLWQEFCRWCPPQVVIERHRHRLKTDWTPGGSFELVFYNKYGGYSKLECGGFIENAMGSWEGPNVSFVYADEMRHHKTPIALKTFDGRVRIPGPMQEEPQLYYTTTPRKHWLYDYFGPRYPGDKYGDFKKDMFCGRIPVELNRENLADGYVDKRRQSLTEAEARVIMDAEWEDISDAMQFVHMEWWHDCQTTLPPYNKEACICAIDISKGRESAKPDNGALVIVSRHPEIFDTLIVRHVRVWDLLRGEEFNFKLLDKEIDYVSNNFTIVEYAYDSYQLAFWVQMQRQTRPGYYREFNQNNERLLSDSALQARIMTGQILHDGSPILTEQVGNANCKKYRSADEESGYKIRIVKKHNSAKIDAAVALSMAAHRAAWYNVV